MSDTTLVLVETFFGGICMRVLAAMLFDSLALRRSGGR